MSVSRVRYIFLPQIIISKESISVTYYPRWCTLFYGRCLSLFVCVETRKCDTLRENLIYCSTYITSNAEKYGAIQKYKPQCASFSSKKTSFKRHNLIFTNILPVWTEESLILTKILPVWKQQVHKQNSWTPCCWSNASDIDDKVTLPPRDPHRQTKMTTRRAK